MKIKSFSVTLLVDAGLHDLDFDANVDVELLKHAFLEEQQLATLTKRLAAVVGDFLREVYADNAEVSVCT